MKRTLVFTLFLLAIVGSAFATTSSINLYQDPIPPGPTPRSLTFLPVSATISETELAFYFDGNFGTAYITVYNESNQVVESEAIDTSIAEEMLIPTVEWNSGNYTIFVSYGSKTLKGTFQIH